jgi:hypothetical protein
MQPNHIERSQDNLLRFVFDDKVLSLNVAADATLEDIARTFGKLSRQQHRKPVALDITLPRPA